MVKLLLKDKKELKEMNKKVEDDLAKLRTSMEDVDKHKGTIFSKHTRLSGEVDHQKKLQTRERRTSSSSKL